MNGDRLDVIILNQISQLKATTFDRKYKDYVYRKMLVQEYLKK